MVVGRRGQLHLSPRRQFLVQRQDAGQHLALHLQHGGLVRLREIPPLGAQFPQHRPFVFAERMEPGQVEPDLQVQEVAVSGMEADHPVPGRHEEVVEYELGVLELQVRRGDLRAPKKSIRRAPFHVVQQLVHHRRHQVDDATRPGIVRQQAGHAVVVLDPVQPDPGHGQFARRRLLVVGLVLVPENGQRHIHRRSLRLRAPRPAKGARSYRPSPAVFPRQLRPEYRIRR